MDRPIRNVDRPEIKTKKDAIILWLKETQPKEYSKNILLSYNDDAYDWWEPARYELHKIIDWLLSPVTKKEEVNNDRYEKNSQANDRKTDCAISGTQG